MNAANPVEIKATIPVAGQYKLIRRKAVTLPDGEVVAGDIVEETPWCKNILTLYYFNQAMTNQTLQVQGCVVGTGNATPLETNTGLQTYLAQTTSIQGTITWTKNWTVSPRYSKMSTTYRFGAGVAAGNVAEVGMVVTSSGVNSSTPIISRALVVDGVGTPTSITILSDEFLDVVWECTWYVPEDVTGSFNMTIDGVSTAFNYTVRGVGLNTNLWGLSGSGTNRIGCGAPWVSSSDGTHSTTAHCGASTNSSLLGYDVTTTVSIADRCTSQGQAAYVADSKVRSNTLIWDLNHGNIAIRSIYVTFGGAFTNSQGLGAFQVLLNNPVTKVNTKVFSFVFNISMANAP